MELVYDHTTHHTTPPLHSLTLSHTHVHMHTQMTSDAAIMKGAIQFSQKPFLTFRKHMKELEHIHELGSTPTELKQEAEQREEEGDARAKQLNHTPTKLEERA